MTTAAYLAKRMIAERGFRPGTVPEAEPLLAAADLVLTRANGMNLQILLLAGGSSCPAVADPRHGSELLVDPPAADPPRRDQLVVMAGSIMVLCGC